MPKMIVFYEEIRCWNYRVDKYENPL
ncbi:uncharacterized protein METZ01_LOCUS64388 [marine metagenome]|uniref:Uncharacterized protein n=1 Tax=marine metagenome TaxID=408172 RepID=A0A381T720_9ZZZZ